MNREFILKAGKIERATRNSAAFDLFYNGTVPLLIGNEPVAIPTGVITEFDPQYVCIIKEKSGLALKGLEIKGGVIDSDYREEWKVICRNPIMTTFEITPEGFIAPSSIRLKPDWKPIEIKPGAKVAQFVISRLPFIHPVPEDGAIVIIKDEERKGGFGSTGT